MVGLDISRWTRAEILAYISEHSPSEEDWDGSPWPLAERQEDGSYLCRVCQSEVEGPEEPHDCTPARG